VSRLSRKYDSLDVLQNYRPPRLVTGMTLLFFFCLYIQIFCFWKVIVRIFFCSNKHIRVALVSHLGSQGSIPGSGQVGFVVDKVALGRVFSEYLGFPCPSSFHQIPHHNHPRQATVGQSVAAVPSGPSWTPPPTKRIKIRVE
jgi:hypothetical protein